MADNAYVRRAGPLAWGLAALAATLTLAGRVIYYTTDAYEFVGAEFVLVAITAAYAIVGALVASRQPRNAIGWISSASRCRPGSRSSPTAWSRTGCSHTRA